MSCRIFRDTETDSVTRVENLKGEESQLYKNALALTKNQEEALNIWAYAYTPGFIESYGEWQNKPLLKLNKTGEPTISDVLMELNMDKGNSLLGLKESVDIHNFLANSELTVDSLYSNLKKAFFNSQGQFEINRKKLIITGLYLQDEIKAMMDYPSVRGKVLETLNKMRNSLKQEGNVFSGVASIGVDPNHPLHVNTGEIDSLGKFESIPVEEVENYLKDNLGEFVSEETFMEGINSLEREDIRDAILNNPESIDYTRQLIQNNKTVPVFISRDGILVQKNVNDTVELIKNTLTVNDSKVFFTEAIDNLRSLENETWYNNSESVLRMLSDIENKGAKAGIDLSGLQAQYSMKSQEEIVGFLDLIDDFNIKTEELTLEDQDITEFSNDLVEFFEREVKPEFKSVPVTQSLRNRNLILVEGLVDEAEVYRTDGLVKAMGNLYQRVDNFNDFNSAVEEVYNGLLKDITILPREAFSTFGLSKGYYDSKAITNPANKSKVINSISNFVTKNIKDLGVSEDFDTKKEIELMKAVFKLGNPEIIAENNIADRVQSFTGEYSYLTTDFISDFYSRMLEEKVIKKSELWDTALKYFTVNNLGIDMLTQSPEILSQIKLVLQSQPILYSNLVNYSLISKNQNLDFLHEFSSDIVMDTIENRRDYVTNHPEILESMKKDYTKVTDDTVIVKNSTDEFIKLNDGIYELTTSDNGVAVYSRLITGVNPNFYEFGLSYPIIEDVDVKSFKDTSPQKFVEDVSGISKTKLNDIQDEMSCAI